MAGTRMGMALPAFVPWHRGVGVKNESLLCHRRASARLNMRSEAGRRREFDEASARGSGSASGAGRTRRIDAAGGVVYIAVKMPSCVLGVIAGGMSETDFLRRPQLHRRGDRATPLVAMLMPNAI